MKLQNFQLHPFLERDTIFVQDLPTAQLLLMNDRRYPWLIIVPTIPGAREIHDLTREQQIEVLDTITKVSRTLQEIYDPDKINIGALGNIVEQLHIHIIARTTSDPAWPGPVWGHSQAIVYDDDQIKHVVNSLRNTL